MKPSIIADNPSSFTVNITLPQSVRTMLRVFCGLPSRPLGDPPTTARRVTGTSAATRHTVIRPWATTPGFLRMEVDGNKKATGRFTLFSNGRVLTGTLEGTSEALTRLVEVSLQAHPGTGHKASGIKRAVLPIARSRYEACDH